MAKCYITEENRLIINGTYENTLDIEGFSQMMKNPSYCYKFYWLEAIINLISIGVQETTFNEIIDEMITNAWFSVREYHIHLSGIKADGTLLDGLERTIVLLSQLSGLPASASKDEIKNAIRKYEKELKRTKEQLTHMVPYRALSEFFDKYEQKVNWNSARKMTESIRIINQTIVCLPYTFGNSSSLKKEVYFHHEWMKMIQDNMVSILGWIRYEKVKWLQNVNPEVPGLVYKLSSMDEKVRKLNNVRVLWEDILKIKEIRDVFTGETIVSRKYDLDHFIPWSFVMNDELWNLMPMDSSLNSSKNNRLPKWEPFFKSFANNQYLMYSAIQEIPTIRKHFEACYKDNLHSIWAVRELYREGNSKEKFINILQENMKPVYDSARRQGYEIWKI